MRTLFLASFLLFSLTAISQPLINQCQQRHLGSSFLSGRNAAITDYDIHHIDLYVDSINFSGQQLKCHAGLSVIAELSAVTTVNVDLLNFNIDSIVSNGYSISYNYNDTVISIQFSPAISLGDTAVVWIYYQGTPSQDASGWGGFYFNGNYAFNLGVGFMADPHNFGRAWFPCADNFTERSTYDFHITTPAGSKAFCNGTLQQSVINPNNTVTWHWKINQTIPSYLASMAVAPYHTLQRISNGIPVEWAALPTDTNNVLNTFSNLDTILASYINAYGAYPFDKVGYCLIPFNSGAMEHASSIHIGRAFINGTQTYSTLWAHELAHMWWGDKVTCQTAADMWLNEGFATYNEAFYTQIISGPTAYNDWIRSNHHKVVQFAHTPAQDGSYLTMNAIPQANTYGFHVYQKGADLVHTLRNYMGDAAFFSGCQAYMNNQAYSDATSSDLRDELTNATGIDMTRFFDDWIFTAGFPHFSIDSVIHIPGGLDHMFVYTRQRSVGNTHLYEMPVELNFSNGFTDTSVTVMIDSVTNMFHIPLYFMPEWTTIDRSEKVSDAIVSNEKLVTTTGSIQVAETNTTLNVQSAGAGSNIVRVEHNYIPPDPFVNSNPGIRLSDYHYWKVSGIFTPGFLSKGVFVYDGSTSSTTGYLDNTFITGNEDSLVILYRPGAGYNWEVSSSFLHNIGPSNTDKKGSFTVDTLQQGEYTIGMYDYTVGLQEHAPGNGLISVSPNPSRGSFTISFKNERGAKYRVIIYDMGGRIVDEIKNTESMQVEWNAEKFQPGMYQVVLIENGRKAAGEKLILTR
jgi:hypothetical protein